MVQDYQLTVEPLQEKLKRGVAIFVIGNDYNAIALSDEAVFFAQSTDAFMSESYKVILILVLPVTGVKSTSNKLVFIALNAASD